MCIPNKTYENKTNNFSISRYLIRLGLNSIFLKSKQNNHHESPYLLFFYLKSRLKPVGHFMSKRLIIYISLI